MSTVHGTGEHRYRIIDDWARVPPGMQWREVAAVAVDGRDRVYAFNRGPHPMMVFDRDGEFLCSWGEGVFERAHGAYYAPDDTLYLTDDAGHSVRRCTLEGRVLMTLGVPGSPAPYMSQQPFHRCTHTALSPEGDLYVSDGYGNACVHTYSPEGKLLRTWGGPGSGPGEFNLPHNICCDADGWVYVADRESHRIQVFDGQGRFETQWNNLHRPSGLYMPPGRCPICYVGECGPALSVNRDAPNLGPRISILDNQGTLLSRIGDPAGAGTGPGQFISPHGLAVDSHGDVYVAEVSATAWSLLRPEEPVSEPLNCLKKLVRVA
jgi:DNA-binding beta-propeller fold protein YncE